MGVQPQVLPRFIGFATYQLDSNLRNSTMVGIVGGGGIGAALFTAYQRFDFDVVLAILIVIVSLIMIAEIVSGWARRDLSMTVVDSLAPRLAAVHAAAAAVALRDFTCSSSRLSLPRCDDRRHPGISL